MYGLQKQFYKHIMQLSASDLQAEHFRQALHKRTSLAVLIKVKLTNVAS